MKRFGWLSAGLIGALLISWHFSQRSNERGATEASAQENAAEARLTPSRPSIAAPSTSPSSNPAEISSALTISAFADALNAADRDISADLLTLATVLESFRSNFPSSGNPVGDNAEIAAVLTGRNALRLAMIAPDHRALNAQGELCDRWGTPFFFHQLSGSEMEIRSAGPDRSLHTPDDAVLTP